jgi:hypothetical protein
MTFKTDYRLGEHDPLLWPQPYLEPQCHLACIPRRVEVFEESARPVFKILFHQVGFPDFRPLANGPISGLGFLCGERMASLKKLGNFLQGQFDSLDPKITGSTPILGNLLVFIKRTPVNLESLPMTKRQALFLFAEVQRYMLKFSAGYRYLAIYKPPMVNVLPASTRVEALVGAFVFTHADADNFMRAEIPVWLIRPAALVGTVRVEKLVDLIEPRNRFCLADAYDAYPVCYEGPPVNIDRYKTFARYSATFLSYHNPFQSDSSTPSTPIVRVFPSQPSLPKAGPLPGSSGVNCHQPSSSSSRHPSCKC